jgi:hypothetical protein
MKQAQDHLFMYLIIPGHCYFVNHNNLSYAPPQAQAIRGGVSPIFGENVPDIFAVASATEVHSISAGDLPTIGDAPDPGRRQIGFELLTYAYCSKVSLYWNWTKERLR